MTFLVAGRMRFEVKLAVGRVELLEGLGVLREIQGKIMNRKEVDEVIRREGLEPYARFGTPDGTGPEKVFLFRDGERWYTAMSDERAVVQPETTREFDSESEALDDMLDGLRVLKSEQEFERYL